MSRAPQVRSAFARLLQASGRTAAWAVAVLLTLIAAAPPAQALKAITLSQDQAKIEITTLGDLYEGRGDSLQVESASGPDGVAGRMSVAAETPGTNPNWTVFALTNPTDKPIERWLTADRYNVIGSGVVWPDLDAERIRAITPSIGFVPERIKSDRADVFRITLEPGQTITYVVELSSERFARIYLWNPLDYELKISGRQLFNGVMLGLTGLMAIFLTAIFAANHKLVFPASALVAWCALGYLCVEFGFFHKLFQMKPEGNAVYRAAAEAALATSLVIFLHVFLRLALWHGLVRMLITVWLLAQFSLIAVAAIDPRLAATFARLSFIGIGVIGAGLIAFLALRGQDRALSLIPTWILFLVWMFCAGVTLTGKLSGEIVGSGLVAGLVLILLLIGFTVTQYAFRSIEPLYGVAPSELQLRAIAVDAAGAAVWEWNARRDTIKVSPLVESWLGLNPGELSARLDDFVRHLHPADRERFRLALWSIQERVDARICCDFRMRQSDNSYRWFELEASGVPGSDPRAYKSIGLIRDVTDAKRAHERLMHDAVNDSLTGLPNRELLLDRLGVAMARSKSEAHLKPALICVDLDKFKTMNSSFGLVLGDSLLLTIARRLQRHLAPSDTLARLGGDQFTVLVLSEPSPNELAAHAERIRRSLRSPIKIAGQEIVITGSIGVAMCDGTEETHQELLKRAETAMYRAKRAGADRVEIFTPAMHTDRDDRRALESELRTALEKNQLKILYRPVMYLPTEELAGFEALIRWEHPALGVIDPTAFVAIAEESDLVVKLGSHVLLRAARDAALWQKEHPRADAPLFVSVSIASRQLFRQDLIQEIRHILGRNVVPKGSLRIEVPERLAMENPEQASEILAWLRAAGAEIALDDFGAGHSSLCYLERLPFDAIKIDQTLMSSAGTARTGAESSLVRSLCAMAHELGKKVVVKGVESDKDVGFLRSIGCEYAQGPYCGEPIPSAEILQVLAMLRRRESKLEPRGLFRTKPKKRPRKQTARPAAAAAPPGERTRTGAPGGMRVVSSLPNSAVRTRTQPPTRAPATALPPQRQRSQGLVAEAPPHPFAAPLAAPQRAAAQASPPPPPLPRGATGSTPPSPPPLLQVVRPPDAPPPSAGSQERTQPPPVPPPIPGSSERRAEPEPFGRAPPPPPTPPFERAAPAARPAPAPPLAAAAQRVPPPPPRPAPPPGKPPPDFSGLPPQIAESLARLAGAVPRKPKEASEA